MVFLKGDETPSKIIILAYGLEDGLGSFYRAMASKMTDRDVEGILMKLAAIEVFHKQKLFELYRDKNPDVDDIKTFETKIVSNAMEGGLSTEEFLEQNKSAMETVVDVLNIAMMIETQSLDLYLRYSQKSSDKRTKAILFDLAEEEKDHLKALGDMIEKKIPEEMK